MSLYDGFFDAEKLEGQYHEDGRQKYDREYGVDDFTGYFAKVIGSGVCVHNNPDSMLVYLDGSTAIVKPGYLFIEGHWLANVPGPGEDSATYKGYEIPLPGTGNYAIVAQLNLATKRIELDARTIETAYTDSLVLAIVSPTAAEDTRHNTDLCGVIDTAGELSAKVEWVINYIHNEIEAKLAGIERDIATQSAKLDAKIAAVQAVADSIVPPPVGTIKFSASQDVGEEWLRCDGSFVNEADYPELVAALGKLTPSADKFQVISDGEIGQNISNGVIYEGRMWVYSYSTQKLYGVDLNGGGVKEITVTSEDPDFTRVHIPSTTDPIALSIVKSPVDGKARIFLAQILHSGTATSDNIKSYLLLYSAEFFTGDDTISVSVPFDGIDSNAIFDGRTCVPYVISSNVSGSETFSMVTYLQSATQLNTIEWTSTGEDATAKTYGSYSGTSSHYLTNGQRVALNRKSKDEAVFAEGGRSGGGTQSNPYYYYTYVESYKNGTFFRVGGGDSSGVKEILGTPGPLNIVGEDKMLFEPSTSAALVISLKDLDIPKQVNFGLSLPSGARTFVDAGAYLWGKDIYMLFVGTGIIFSRTLEKGSFGYLDTTDTLGQITQFGYLDYSEDEGTLYLLGQDTTNKVKVAKIVLNTLYNYANDGAWLPMIASDGVPAYIKAHETGSGAITDPVDVKIAVTVDGEFARYADLLFDGEAIISGSYTRTLSQSGTFTVGVRIKERYSPTDTYVGVRLGTTTVARLQTNKSVGTTETVSFKVSDYAASGITLSGVFGGANI